jgi:hypothetical protein
MKLDRPRYKCDWCYYTESLDWINFVKEKTVIVHINSSKQCEFEVCLHNLDFCSNTCMHKYILYTCIRQLPGGDMAPGAGLLCDC